MAGSPCRRADFVPQEPSPRMSREPPTMARATRARNPTPLGRTKTRSQPAWVPHPAAHRPRVLSPVLSAIRSGLTKRRMHILDLKRLEQPSATALGGSHDGLSRLATPLQSLMSTWPNHSSSPDCEAPGPAKRCSVRMMPQRPSMSRSSNTTCARIGTRSMWIAAPTAPRHR